MKYFLKNHYEEL